VTEFFGRLHYDPALDEPDDGWHDTGANGQAEAEPADLEPAEAEPTDLEPAEAEPADFEPDAGGARLPDDFWCARPQLAHVRQAAHSRQRSADAVLHVVLARVAASTAHTTLIPAVVGAPKPLCYFANLLASPGVGKTDADAIGTELVPAPAYVVDHVPPGSGEGLAELLFELIDEPGDNGKVRQVKRQTKHNAYVYVDEGQVLAELGNRSGATLLPTMRSIWSGATLGQSNASRERHRVAPAFSYVFGIVAGFQAVRVGPLLADADSGTPQRFGWAYATDPSVPDTAPDWPGPLDWEPAPLIAGGYVLDVATEIAEEIRVADLARIRGEAAVDPLDAHAGLYRLKVAGLLAVLERRWDVTPDDWELAGMIKAASDAARANAVAAVAYEERRKEQRSRDRYARREVEADTATRRTRTVDGARKIAGKVWKEPDRWTVRALQRSMSRWVLEVWDDAFGHALAEGWVVETDEPGQGTDKRCLRPGENRP
jgi:hypothetical protein